jgi:RNA polymerase sigma-70 factor (ECF subfamily)
LSHNPAPARYLDDGNGDERLHVRTTGSAATSKLLGQIRDGDTQAVAQLYQDLQKPIYILAYSILRSHALAEDAVQESFVKVMSRASAYQPIGSARAWVMRIARNTAIDMLRSEGRALPLEGDHAQEDGALAEAEPQMDFLAATRPLSELDRSIVVLRVAAGMTHAEVAKAVGMSAVAVRARYRRILKRLKAFYEKGTQ